VIDDITDISLRAVAGGTPLTPAFDVAPNNALSDGVDASDSFNRGSLQEFPYLATPYQGYELDNQPRDGD
jgi:hypothetical protein